MERQKVIIEPFDEPTPGWSIYGEDGGVIESDFPRYEDALKYALDNDYCVVNLFNVRDKEPKKEFRVYVVDVDDLESDTELPGHEDFDPELFMQKAEECGNIYTLKGFQNAFNNKEVNTEYELLLIKEVEVYE